MALNITTAVIGSGCNTATASPSLVQWDRGQILQIEGVTLPETFQVEFSTLDTIEALTRTGTSAGVEIPDVLLQRSSPITAYIVLSESQDERETEYWVNIYIKPRQMPDGIIPDPVPVITEKITQLETSILQNAGNILAEIGDFSEHPTPKLTCEWTDGNARAHITGITTYQSPIGIYSSYDAGSIAPELEFDTEYQFLFRSDSRMVKAFLWIGSSEQELTGDTTFTIPTGTTSVEIGLLVEAGTIDAHVMIGIPFPKSHADLQDELNNLRDDVITDAQINALFS